MGEERRGRLELVVERFARSMGRMFLLDMARPDSQEASRRGGRLVFRERFRRFLTRQFPAWKLAEISAEQDLEHSLSPGFPRALLRKGRRDWLRSAAAPDGMDPSAILSFGLDLARLPAAPRAAHHDRAADPASARGRRAGDLPSHSVSRIRSGRACEVFALLRGRLRGARWIRATTAIWRRSWTFSAADAEAQAWVERLRGLPDVECVENNNGTVEPARARVWNLRAHRGTSCSSVCRNARRRGSGTSPRSRRWRLGSLSCELRRAALCTEGSGGVAGGAGSCAVGRGGCSLARRAGLQPGAGVSGRPARSDRSAGGRLFRPAGGDGAEGIAGYSFAVAGARLLDAREVASRSRRVLRARIFSGVELRKDAPRAAAGLAVRWNFIRPPRRSLQYFSSAVEVERVGVGANWREKLQVMFRLRGAENPS